MGLPKNRITTVPVSSLYGKPNLYFKIINCDDDIGYFVVDHSENWVVIFRYPWKANQDTNQLPNKEDTFLNACPFPR